MARHIRGKADQEFLYILVAILLLACMFLLAEANASVDRRSGPPRLELNGPAYSTYLLARYYPLFIIEGDQYMELYVAPWEVDLTN